MSSTGQREPSKVEDLGHSKIDVDRMGRLGIPEAVFAAGKTVDQCVEIVSRLLEQTNHPVVVTRSTAEQRTALDSLAPQAMQSNTLSWQHSPVMAVNPVVIVSGGTSDQSVVDEAQVTLQALGAPTKVVQDVGVAGLHRLLNSLDQISEASVVIVVAGMEGSLSTVLTGGIRQQLGRHHGNVVGNGFLCSGHERGGHRQWLRRSLRCYADSESEI